MERGPHEEPRAETVAAAERLPLGMLWVLGFAPPFLALMFWGTQSASRDLRALVEDLVAIWVYVVGVGVAIHFGVDRMHATRWALGRKIAARVALDMGLVVLVVAAVSAVLLPLLAFVTPRIHVWSECVRAVVLGWAYVAVGRALARLRARAVAEALRADAAQRAALEAKLQALQARTNPHFLFNTLNAVASLIATDPARAEEIVEKLSSLFRYALDGAEVKTVPLRVELDAVRDYLSIERARFGERLDASVELAADDGAIDVPPLLVQPLVENAILHGLSGRAGPGHVWVRAFGTAKGVEIVVEDDGVGPGGSRRHGSGTALRGIRDRLALLFGDAARLETGKREGGGYRAALFIPKEAP